MQGRIPGPVPEGLTLFETMRVEADGRVALWPLHLARLGRGCAALGFPPPDAGLAELPAGLPRGRVWRARLSVARDGAVRLDHAALPDNPPFWRVVLSGVRLRSDDPWLGIKSSHRPAYEAARAALPPGIDEAILLNQHDEPCEGAITSVFVQRDGRLLTPPLTRGLLPGVLRRHLIDTRRAAEADLSLDDLRQGPLFCGNALRGLIPARLQDPPPPAP